VDDFIKLDRRVTLDVIHANFPHVEEFLGGQRFASDEELQEVVTTILNGLAAEEYDQGITKLVPRYDKCLNVGGDYVEK